MSTDPRRCPRLHPEARWAGTPDPSPRHVCSQPLAKGGEQQRLLGAGRWAAETRPGQGRTTRELRLHTPSTCTVVPPTSLRKHKFKDKVQTLRRLHTEHGTPSEGLPPEDGATCAHSDHLPVKLPLLGELQPFKKSKVPVSGLDMWSRPVLLEGKVLL